MSTSTADANKALNLVAEKIQRLILKAEKQGEGTSAAKAAAHDIASALVSVDRVIFSVYYIIDVHFR
jgi:hypothetical protein